MKIARVTNISDAIEELKQAGLWVCGTDMNTNTYYYDQDFKMPIAIVIGSEGFGMSRLVKENCQYHTVYNCNHASLCCCKYTGNNTADNNNDHKQTWDRL